MELYPIDIAIHLVNIAILYILLRVLIWKPVQKFMADRETRIQSEMDKARQMQEEAQQQKADYDARLREAQTACDQILADGRKQAMASAQKYVDEAKAEAGKIMAQARTDAAEEKQRAMDDAKGELVDLAVDMAGRVLRFDAETRGNVLGSGEKTGHRKGVLKLAAPCSNEETAAIADRLERLLGCHLELTTEIDPALIGGFTALVDGKAYDFSYATQLTAMQQKLA